MCQFPIYFFLQLIHLSDNSDRIAIQGEKLFPPYTQLGWDQTASALGDVDVEGVSRVEHIVGYGRPLYYSFPFASASG